MESKLELQIQKLKDELKKKEALKQLKHNAQRTRDKVKERKALGHLKHRLGGLVYKMGLHQLDDELLLGSLLSIHQGLQQRSPEQIDSIKKQGAVYLPVGKQLQPVNPSGVATPAPAN